ncbi:hypothetical protein JZO82_04135 [Vagococcus fluvialis]|jgi:hypothetical protein|uniref:Uncharacterized protein n=1 Tax=Vagococcus fluvialis TaxID=2738 RepID=A0A7X6I3F6_9ENTE|nr:MULTISPECIES: hypothetical protein [Vagococcus]MBO0428345.1 hypothetical protein [Vagococcus fluvialis]MDR2276669.1 hypothetical protein [Vagococcus sp.]MDT2840914.1 hypothetical protein [Vagococcus carniphilus]NKC68486.1 hypothetical protein [Vagococcus fluvialis]
MAEITKTKLAEKEKIVKVLIEQGGESYNNWLARKFDEIIMENSEKILTALDNQKNKQASQSHNQSNHHS